VSGDPALHEAARFLPAASPEQHAAFAARHGAALRRLSALVAFYAANDCRMARLHRLGSSVVVLSRFAGLSDAFNLAGDLLQPVDEQGRPRTLEWRAYADACARSRALDVRDELWMVAHTLDMQRLRESGMEEQFEAERAAHPQERLWALMRRHLDFTLGARRDDEAALSGHTALQTAMARALGHSLGAMVREGGATFLHTALIGLRALIDGQSRGPGQPSSRQVALWVLRGIAVALPMLSVWRKGQREAIRGALAPEASWPILAQTLGSDVAQVHPAVVAFYENPAKYDVRCTLELHTVPARLWARLLTAVAGQGLFEAGEREYESRIRTYRRADGAMHFVREVDTGRALRIFDSDFLVRPHHGRPTLFERFPDLSLEYELIVRPLGPGLGVSIQGRDLYWRGIRLPSTGLQVEFQSAVTTGAEGEILHLDGVLAQRPRTALGHFFVRKVLRRPEILGRIRYRALRGDGPAGEAPFLT
jgi:hypothetical protein